MFLHFCIFFDVKSVENKNQDESISDKWTRLPRASSVKNGHWIHRIQYCQNTRMINFLTGVARQQTTTVAIQIRRGMKESGAIQWIQMCPGKHVTFHSVVRLILLLEYFHLYTLPNSG